MKICCWLLGFEFKVSVFFIIYNKSLPRTYLKIKRSINILKECDILPNVGFNILECLTNDSLSKIMSQENHSFYIKKLNGVVF